MRRSGSRRCMGWGIGLIYEKQILPQRRGDADLRESIKNLRPFRSLSASRRLCGMLAQFCKSVTTGMNKIFRVGGGVWRNL
jgi:hypothetical protein